MRIAIVQSNYIPWKGYFDLINAADEFVLLDDVQFTRRDWRNRNRIKTPRGPAWLTIPVSSKGLYHARISDIVASDPDWADRHWRMLAANYARAPHFPAYAAAIEQLYRASDDARLSAINRHWLHGLCGILGVTTKISCSSEYEAGTDRTGRLVDICRQAGAATYLSGPSARAYIDETRFAAAGIALEYFDYAGYPEYPQLFPPFDHQVSVLDLIFNTGPDATRYMLSF